DGLGGHRLARARLAEDRKRLALGQVEVDAVDRLGVTVTSVEDDVEVAHLQQGCARDIAVFGLQLGRRGRRHHRLFGSRASRTASPNMMKPSTVSDRKRAGKKSMCGVVRM